ncbi:hypothetical protein FHX42_002904 [Saccharopolyspora lacisalsi]|uniref:Uncharacterized protein n=1 Tax=Halosaccharopolyspora lacisalsi TaxID=1000566 RepID=A0A839DWZ0_9PSEU|nr:arylamine N-acetyltransferase [Halosaccharopolyspora lacisalsi]MBA8825553.1 hypothetical protein [Halosaccharopolyspora lacisalsi]
MVARTSIPTRRTTENDEWDIAAVDVEAYLERIDHPRVSPSTEALRSLHEAHVRTIPFENIDVVLGRHPGLEPHGAGEAAASGGLRGRPPLHRDPPFRKCVKACTS